MAARLDVGWLTGPLALTALLTGCASNDVQLGGPTPAEFAARNVVSLRILRHTEPSSASADASIVFRGTGCVLGGVFDDPEIMVVLTNHHVVERIIADTTTHSVLVEHYPFGAFDGVVAGAVLCYDKDRDLALIKVPRLNFTQRGLLLREMPPRTADTTDAFAAVFEDRGSVSCVPTPISVVLPAASNPASIFTKLVPSSAEGSHGASFTPTMRQWQMAFRPKPGMSGSPVVNERGELIGLACSASGSAGFAVHLMEIREFLHDFRHIVEVERSPGRIFSRLTPHSGNS